MINLYSLLLLTAAAVAYCISQLIMHGKFKGDTQIGSNKFWSPGGWMLKYKDDDSTGWMVKAPTTYYYKLFNLKYKERFPGSATFLVALTDGYHLMQLIFTTLTCLSLSILTPHPILMWLAFRTAWGIAFTITYKLAAK